MGGHHFVSRARLWPLKGPLQQFGERPYSGPPSSELQEELRTARADLDLTITDLRAILEATPNFVCAIDPQGCVSGWNNAAVECTGLRRD